MDDSPAPRYPWWELAIGSAVGFGASLASWWYLTSLEETPGPHRVHAVLALLYGWGGKWLCVLVFAAIGALFAAGSVWRWFRPGTGQDTSGKSDGASS